MNAPQVSILIPVYNREKYIAECIQAALDQTFQNFEIIVVDNASNDGTWAICQQFAALDPRVRIFRNDTNIGSVRNWIRCVQEARGHYSKMLFSDDLLEPDCLARMLVPLDNPAVGLVSCAARIGESKENACVAYSVAGPTLIHQKKYLSRLLDNRAPVSPGAVLLRTKDLIQNLHADFATATKRDFDKYGTGPDVMIMLLTALSYPRVFCINEPLVFFRAHAGSFSIANANNDVSMGYTSAIAYYLFRNESWYLWLKYLVRLWIFNIHSQKKWINPITFLKSNEGCGSIVENLVAGMMTPFLLVRMIASRANC